MKTRRDLREPRMTLTRIVRDPRKRLIRLTKSGRDPRQG